MVTPAARITAAASVFPPALAQEELWSGFFAAHFEGRDAGRRAFFSVGVERRHAAASPLEEDLSGWSTAARMERYLLEAMPLGKEAMSTVLDRAGLRADQVGLLAVVSCTGYATPGIDILIARDLGMSPELKRLFVGHVGCHAALPALDMVRHYVAAERQPAVLLCLELPSLHVQPPSRPLEDVVVHALFSDAASAVVVEPSTTARAGWSVLDVLASTDAASADQMTWNITDHGFKMNLSRRVPDVLAETVGPLVERLLARNGLRRHDVGAWALHPGGPRVLEVIAERLGLGEEELEPARRVLVEHGNCSSATVLLVLEALATGRAPTSGHYAVAMAFGPGLTLCAALLQWRCG